MKSKNPKSSKQPENTFSIKKYFQSVKSVPYETLHDNSPKPPPLKKLKEANILKENKKPTPLKQSCLKFENDKTIKNIDLYPPKNNDSLLPTNTNRSSCSEENDNDKNKTSKQLNFFNNIEKLKMSTVQKALFYKKLEKSYENAIEKIPIFKIFRESLQTSLLLELGKEKIGVNNETFIKELIKFCLMKFLFENANDSWHKIYKPLSSKEVKIKF